MVQSVHGIRLIQPALPSQRDRNERQRFDYTSTIDALPNRRATPGYGETSAHRAPVHGGGSPVASATYTTQLIASDLRLPLAVPQFRSADALKAYHVTRRYGSGQEGSSGSTLAEF